MLYASCLFLGCVIIILSSIFAILSILDDRTAVLSSILHFLRFWTIDAILKAKGYVCKLLNVIIYRKLIDVIGTRDIKVVTGVRRSGKSVLLELLAV